MFNNTDYFYFMPSSKSERLLIIFSGAGARSFNCFKLLKDYPINRLFIRDASRSWYQNPVREHWQNIDDMVDLIRTISDRFEPSKIICMGGSMGGYAAMITAAKIRAGQALLFSPQTVLDYRLPNNPPAHIKIRHADAFNLLTQSPETKVDIFLGTEDLADLYNVYPALCYRRFNVHFIYGGPHNVMNFLSQRNMLKELIASRLENRQPRIVYPELKLFASLNLYRDICEFVKGFYFDEVDFSSLDKLMDGLVKASPDWAALYHYRGKLYAKFGHHADAIIQFEQAISRNNKDEAIFSDLGLSAIQAVQYEKAEEAFRQADAVSITTSAMYLSKIGAALMLQKRYDEAIEMQYKALEVNDSYAAAYYQLGLVMNITGRYEEAVPMFEYAIELGDKNPNIHKHLSTARNKLGSAI